MHLRAQWHHWVWKGASQCFQSHSKKNKPSQQDNRPGKPAAAAYDTPHHVSDVPNGKQDDLGHLLQVQRLPAILSASLPSAEDLGVSLNLPTAGAMIGEVERFSFAPHYSVAA